MGKNRQKPLTHVKHGCISAPRGSFASIFIIFFHSGSIAKDTEYSIYPPVLQQIPTYSAHLTCLHQHTHIPINVVYHFYVVDLNGLFCFSSYVYISSVMQMDENKLMQTIENCAWFMWILLSRCDGFSYFFPFSNNHIFSFSPLRLYAYNRKKNSLIESSTSTTTILVKY